MADQHPETASTADKNKARPSTVATIVAIIAAAVLVVGFFLPYATATDDARARIEANPGISSSYMPSLKAGDMLDPSLFTYARGYLDLADSMSGSASQGFALYAGLIIATGALSLIALLLASLRKPAGSLVVSLLDLGVLTLLSADFESRGVISASNNLAWSYGHMLLFIAAAAVVAGSIWMIISRRMARKRASAQQ